MYFRRVALGRSARPRVTTLWKALAVGIPRRACSHASLFWSTSIICSPSSITVVSSEVVSVSAISDSPMSISHMDGFHMFGLGDASFGQAFADVVLELIGGDGFAGRRGDAEDY